jgi:hypothetical protein
MSRNLIFVLMYHGHEFLDLTDTVFLLTAQNRNCMSEIYYHVKEVRTVSEPERRFLGGGVFFDSGFRW